MSPQQRFDYEKRLEDDYVNGEIAWSRKKGEILDEWAAVLEYSVKITEISQYIKNRLRLRGASESSINYVHERLDKKYKNPEDSANASLAWKSMPWRDNSDEIAKSTIDMDDLGEMSRAEQYELITKRFKNIKGTKKALTDEADLLEMFAKQHHIRIPELEKLPADIPPEIFHGYSEFYYDIGGFADEIEKIGKQLRDYQKMVFYYRPDPETSKKCSKLLAQYREGAWQQLRFNIILAAKAIQNMLTPITDQKWAYILSEWLQVGYDQKTAYGSHGSGSVHAVPTGEFILKTYKDGRVELIGLTREGTREQVGDKVKEDIIKMGLIAALNHPLEKMTYKWMDNTILPEVLEVDE